MSTTAPEPSPPAAPADQSSAKAVVIEATPMMSYTTLTEGDQKTIINSRLKELETQHLKLTVTARAPSTNDVSGAQIKQLGVLSNSIEYLQGMLVTVGSRSE